jgi:hypothetical protein
VLQPATKFSGRHPGESKRDFVRELVTFCTSTFKAVNRAALFTPDGSKACLQSAWRLPCWSCPGCKGQVQLKDPKSSESGLLCHSCTPIGFANSHASLACSALALCQRSWMVINVEDDDAAYHNLSPAVLIFYRCIIYTLIVTSYNKQEPRLQTQNVQRCFPHAQRESLKVGCLQPRTGCQAAAVAAQIIRPAVHLQFKAVTLHTSSGCSRCASTRHQVQTLNCQYK